MMQARLAAVAVAAAALLPAVLCAQTYPAKPVRMIVPFGTGGGSDLQARLLSKKFFESMNQTFVVDNRTGAGGNIGAEAGARAVPDGYTVLFTTASLAVNTSLYKKLPFDVQRDLAPVSWVSSVPLVLTTHPSVPAKSLKEFVELGKRRSTAFNASSNGSGTTSHLAIEMMKLSTGMQATHIPYKGGGPSMLAMIAGEVDFSFATTLTSAPYVKAGRIKALAVTTAKPTPSLPGVPTMSSVLPGFEVDNWYAMFVPAGTPKEIIAKLNAETIKALRSAEIKDYMDKEGAIPVGSTPEELTAYLKREIDKYAKVIRSANVQVE